MTIGIVGAMPEEIRALTEALGPSRRSVERGMRVYEAGSLCGHDVVVVFSRWGKVAAASTATQLIASYGVNEIIFVGVAGGMAPGVRVGDIVVAHSLFQHDIDARPMFARHEIPLLNVTAVETDPRRRDLLTAASRKVVGSIDRFVPRDVLDQFGIHTPAVHVGDIASGDRFFADPAAAAELRTRLPSVLCVEMEGAAVGQVCYEHGVPFSVVRTISDDADAAAPVDFPRFVKGVASVYSAAILRGLLGDG